MKQKTISPFIGIRIKPFTEDLKYRGVRTLDIFLTTLFEKTKGKLPENFGDAAQSNDTGAGYYNGAAI
jgi:hypothetical protein